MENLCKSEKKGKEPVSFTVFKVHSQNYGTLFSPVKHFFTSLIERKQNYSVRCSSKYQLALLLHRTAEVSIMILPNVVYLVLEECEI